MEPATIGFSVIGILQLANFAMTGRVYNKLDKKVETTQHDKDIREIKNLCDERRESCQSGIKACRNARDDRRDRDMEEMHAIEKKISRHTHNGNNSVKFW